MIRGVVRDERGVVVVAAIALVGVLLFLAAVCVGAESIVLAHRRAQASADLAALAGAAALQRGAEPCAAASRIGARQHAVVTRCVVDGRSVLVATAVRLPPALGGAELPARARAGPADTSPGLEPWVG